jgi:hypothetical protein
LERVVFPEGLLNRVKWFRANRKPFNRSHCLTLSLYSKYEARANGLVIHQNRASAANTMLAA